MLNNFHTNDPLPWMLTLIMRMHFNFIRLIFAHSIEYENIPTTNYLDNKMSVILHSLNIFTCMFVKICGGGGGFSHQLYVSVLLLLFAVVLD